MFESRPWHEVFPSFFLSFGANAATLHSNGCNPSSPQPLQSIFTIIQFYHTMRSDIKTAPWETITSMCVCVCVCVCVYIYIYTHTHTHTHICRSKWPRGLRHRSAAARLLRSWVRIPPGHRYLSVASVVCCQVEMSVTSWSLVQRSPTDCAASLCVI